jgi:serine/threonine protein kinase
MNPKHHDPPPAGRFLYASGARPLAGYTIKRGVGQGGFGEIYYATSDAGKDVALKLLRRSLDVELRGIRHCLNLKHPNLLDIHDIRQDAQGDTWVIMEYVADPSLETILADRPTGLPADEALAWIHGIGAAVAYLHSRGIVHRDLKPGNIFRDEGVVKVGDYGLSKFISCSRRSGHTESVGTVHYMAPEVANGRYGKEIDVYAMGIILYELLTGRVPFEGESVGEVLMKHLTALPDVSMIAQPYRSVVARALEKDPEKRYRSASEMLAALPPCPGAAATGRVPLGGPSDREQSRTEEPTSGHFSDGAVPAGAAESAAEDPFLRTLRAAKERFRQAWSEEPSSQTETLPHTAQNRRRWSQSRSDRIVRVLSVYCIVLAPILLPLALVVYGVYRLMGMPGGGARSGPAEGIRRLKTALESAVVMVLIVLQCAILAKAASFRSPLNADDVMGVLVPTAILGSYFLAKWITPRIDKRRRAISYFVVMAFLFWQYVAAAMVAGSRDHPNALLMLLPSILLAAYCLTRWLRPSTEGKQPRTDSAEGSMGTSSPAFDARPLDAIVVEPDAAGAKPARRLWYGDKSAPALPLAPPRERLAELLGSLLLSSLVAAVMCAVMAMLASYCMHAKWLQPEQFVWLQLTSVGGAWSVLILSQWWRRGRGEAALRRFVQMVAGFGLGAASCAMATGLLVRLPPLPDCGKPPDYDLPPIFYAHDNGQPLTLAYMACFGTLFLLMRWWRQADPSRRVRLSLWTLAVTVFVAWVIAQAWQFPQPWLPMVAGAMSAAVQLASPWHRAEKRRR